MKNVLSSPVFQFVVAGLIIFSLYAGFKPEENEVIRVSPQIIDALLSRNQSIAPQPLSDAEKEDLIQDYIDEEVLLKEAYSRGIDKTDYRVRKRLLTIMRSSLTETVPEPTQAQLRAWYEENKTNYKTPVSLSFEHIYFSFSSTNIPEDPSRFRRKLETATEPFKLGEYWIGGNRFWKNTFRIIAGSFGRKFTQKLFDMKTGQWIGPVDSIKGVHYVRLLKRHDPEIPTFEEMGTYLRQDYLLKQAQNSQKEKIDTLRKNYTIIMEDFSK